jgi:hypothetical protein
MRLLPVPRLFPALASCPSLCHCQEAALVVNGRNGLHSVVTIHFSGDQSPVLFSEVSFKAAMPKNYLLLTNLPSFLPLNCLHLLPVRLDGLWSCHLPA